MTGVQTCALPISGCSSNEGGDTKTKDLSEVKVGVIQIAAFDALDQSYEGFKEVLLAAGVLEENIEHHNAGGDTSNATTIAQKLINDQVDLIYTIATGTSQAAASLTSDIPIVFCAVTDPKDAGLVEDYNLPGGNITGASDMNPIDQQLQLLKDLVPTASKIAILYNGSEDNSILQADLAETQAKELGLEVVRKTVSTSADIQSVVSSIVGTVDALYIPTDNLLAENMPAVAQVANPGKLPVITGEDGMVKSGGLATYGLNYTNLGKLAGQQALAILKGENTPDKMPVAYLPGEDCELTINKTTAAEIGVDITGEAFANANIVE